MWARNISVGPRYVATSPDPRAKLLARGSAAKLFRERIAALRAALSEDDVVGAISFRGLAEIAAAIATVEERIEKGLTE